MGKFKNKKLLLLGTSIGSVDIVKHAKSEGAYVIVTDYLPIEKSAAKQVADETAMISTTDVDALIDFSKKKKIDGVFCGVSEVNLKSVRAIATELNLPCYFTQNQWDILANKLEFKRYCKQYGVPVVPEFALPENFTYEDVKKLPFPVMLKPTDSSGARGMNVCYRAEDFNSLYQEALKWSERKEVIIEEFISEADEIFFQYTIQNGECYLSSCFTKVFVKSDNKNLILPLFHMYPSKHLSEYYLTMHENVKRLFAALEIKNGVITLQSFYKEGRFYVFEAGFRMGGAQNYIFTERQTQTNPLKGMVEYALTGSMGQVIADNKDTADFELPCCNYYIGLKPGKIAKIMGVEDIKKMEGVLNITVIHKEGDEIFETNALDRICLRLHVIGDTPEKLALTLEKISQTLQIISSQGEEMQLQPLSYEDCLAAIHYTTSFDKK